MYADIGIRTNDDELLRVEKHINKEFEKVENHSDKKR